MGYINDVFCRVDGLLDDETGTACSSDVTLANTGILNSCLESKKFQ